MFRYFVSSAIMHRNAAVISVTCILLCLTFNYTFPLHRDNTKWNLNSYVNLSWICDKGAEHHDKILDRTKKMASNLDSPVKKFKDTPQDFSNNIQDQAKTINNAFTEEDLRHYEQLVIMKKNPYLDLKEIELKFRPTDKSIRESVKFDSGPLPHVGDPSIWEPMEEGPIVEIINRGLTGFAIPAKIVASPKFVDSRLKINTIKNPDLISSKQDLKLDKTSNIGSHRDDIVYLC